MIVIDYMPGGLGNFIAQVITGFSFDRKRTVASFHHGDVNYDIQLVQRSPDAFREKIVNWKPQYPIAIAHTWNQTELLRKHIDCKLYSVVVREKWIELMMNWYLKAVKSDPLYYQRGDNYYNAFQHFSAYSNWSADAYIEFDNFYKTKDLFVLEIQKLNPNADADKIYDYFCQTQRPIIGHINFLKNYIAANYDVTQLDNFEQVVVDKLKTSA